MGWSNAVSISPGAGTGINMATSNAQTVTAMLATWKTRDAGAIVDFFTPDAIYTNIPIDPPNKGHTEIRAFLDWFFGAVSELEFIIHHQVEGEDGTVMNERTDKLNFNGKPVELPVMGVFEFSNGKICAWRDYFDMALLNALDTDVTVPR
jgi:limonene-1,2-epoxide hydrolase